MIRLAITFLIGAFLVFPSGSQEIGVSNLNYGEPASLDQAKNGPANQEPSSANLAAAPMNYDI